jgi:hypothetical protein
MNHKNTSPPAHHDNMDDNDGDTTQELIIMDDPLDIGSPDNSVDHVLSTIEAATTIRASPTPTTSNSSQPSSSNAPNVCNTTSFTNCRLKTYVAQSAGRSQQIRDEILAISELRKLKQSAVRC